MLGRGARGPSLREMYALLSFASFLFFFKYRGTVAEYYYLTGSVYKSLFLNDFLINNYPFKKYTIVKLKTGVPRCIYGDGEMNQAETDHGCCRSCPSWHGVEWWGQEWIKSDS